MDKKLITEIKRIREIISGKNILLEQAIPKLSQQLFDFALRSGDEFLEFIRPLAQKEAQRIGAATDDLVDMFDKQIGDFIDGYSPVKQFTDDSMKLILRNATNEEFVEFLIKSKLLPSTTDAATAQTIKQVEALGKKGTPVSEEDIEKLVKGYEEEIEKLDFLTDELKDGLVSRFRNKLNQVRVPSLLKVGTQVTPEAVMRYTLGEEKFNKLMKNDEVALQFKNIQNRILGKTWGDAVDEAVAQIEYLKSSEVLKKNVDPSRLGFIQRRLDQLKNGLWDFKRDYGGKEPLRNPDGNFVLNIPKTAWNWAKIIFSVGILYKVVVSAYKEGPIRGPIKFIISDLFGILLDIDDVFKEVRKDYSLVSEEEAKKYLQTLGLNLEDYSFEKDPKDEYKMIALYVGEGEGPDYLIYKEDKVLGHTVYTEEDRNRTLLDILQKFK